MPKGTGSQEHKLTMQLKAQELELAAVTPTLLSRRTEFDVSKQILFVPPVQKAEVDKYLLCFKNIVSSLEWPKEMQTLAAKHATKQGTGSLLSLVSGSQF